MKLLLSRASLCFVYLINDEQKFCLRKRAEPGGKKQLRLALSNSYILTLLAFTLLLFPVFSYRLKAIHGLITGNARPRMVRSPAKVQVLNRRSVI